MIDILPPIYPNELFYGWISRYRSISGNSNKRTMNNLFNRTGSNVHVSIHYPHYLEYFCSNMPKYFDITPEEVIEKHTIIPLFKPFVDDNEYQNIIDSLIKEEYATIQKKRMNSITIHKTRKLYFCKECYKVDYEKYGEYHINRIHQIPGNKICSKHLVELSELEINSNLVQTEFLDINNYELNNDEKKCLIYEEQINLSHDLNDLFNTNLENQNIKLTLDKYDVLLQKKGYKIKDGLINRRRLIKEFNLYYSEKFLKLINSFVEEVDDNGWLNFIGAQKCRYIHPLRHLLFIRFLSGSFLNFITFDHLEEQRTIDNNLKNILLSSDLEFMLNSFNRDFKLIAKNAHRLKVLDGCYYNIKNERLNNERIKNIKKEALEYLSIVKIKDKYQLRVEMRKKFNINFCILEITDKEWVDNKITEYINENYNIVKPLKLNKLSSTIKRKVDWPQRDKELSQKVINAIEEIKGEVPIRKVTSFYISKKIAFRFRKECFNLLPKTMKIIEDNIETNDAFKKRVILFVINQLISEGENVNIRKITERISISKDYQKHRDFILKEIEKINEL